MAKGNWSKYRPRKRCHWCGVVFNNGDVQEEYDGMLYHRSCLGKKLYKESNQQREDAR